MTRITVSLLCLLLIGVGCSTKRDPRDLLAPRGIGTIVVDARLIVGQPVPAIVLRTTQSPVEPYDEFRVGLSRAAVEVRVSTGDTIRYVEYDWPGQYISEADYFGRSVPLVLPNTTYDLHVRAPDGRIVTATTTTPDSFHIRDWLLLDDPTLAVRHRLATFSDFPGHPDSVYLVDSNRLVYQDGFLEARFDRGRALAYQVGLFSLDDGSPYVIDAKFLSAEDLAKLERETSSPPFEAADGSLRLPWFAIFFEGRYRLKIYSVDRNWYDLTRSLRFYGNNNIGFGSTAGDTFEQPLFHVNGGIGLFGSAAVDEIGFFILPRP